MKQDSRKHNKFSINANTTKKQCPHCDRQISAPGIKYHVKFCYLNPTNLKICPVCNSPIKHYKTNITCSWACSNTFFRSGQNHPNWKESAYITTCFLWHPHKCVICGESNIVAVHHFDNDKNNNVPHNLVPLCPTHHQYMHSKHRQLIEEQVNKYILLFRATSSYIPPSSHNSVAGSPQICE
jgi:hypothetical protein